MDSRDYKEIAEETSHETISNPAPVIPRRKEYIIQIPSLHERFTEHHRSKRKRRFLGALPVLEWIKNIRFPSPFAILRRTIHRKEEISLAVPSPAGVRPRFHINFIRKINLSSLLSICREWLSHPMNAALLLWLMCVASSGVMLGLLMLGLLNEAFPTKALRNRWIEINNQILNALFTLMSLYQHPLIFHHLFMLCRWRSEDIVELRKIYCKNSAHRPNEWPHMMVVILLLHITCLAQYALCGVYWGFTSFNRPDVLEYLFIALGVVAPVSAGVYVFYSPLGRECEFNSDEELPGPMMNRVADRKLNGLGVLVREPQWIGGLFDCFSDVTVACLSCCCTCCVFGWNMERLGFGNMYVHIVTFLILCLAPFWIFNISSLKVHDYVIGDVMWISGIVLCVLGLLYGGFWRIQMRKRFRLPENRFCCGSASLTDYLKWLFCWSCALAQEVRTGNFYNVENDSLFRRPSDEEEEEEERKPLLTSPVVSGDGYLETNLEKPNAAEECSEGGCLVAPCVQLLTKVEDEAACLLVRDAGEEAVPPLPKIEENGAIILNRTG